MKKIPLGTTDTTLSRMGLGTRVIGGGPAWNGDLDRQICIDTILEVHRCDINLIDIAPGYNFGNSEVIVGQALKKLPREQVITEAKCGTVWERRGSLFDKIGDRQLYENPSPESIREEVEADLQHLGIDYTDIYMTHQQSMPPSFMPIAETVAVLNALKAEGKIHAISTASIDADRIREYLQHDELDIIQTKYNILDRTMENELLPLCRNNNIVVRVYSPLEQGLLTGTITRDYVPGSARANKVWFQHENMLKVIDIPKQWQPLYAHYQYAVPILAPAWVLRQSDLIPILSGTIAPEQVCENVAVLNINLSDTDATLMKEMAEALER